MKILIVSPTIEDTQGRGINAIAKNLIDSAHDLKYEVGLLTGVPKHKNIKGSRTLNQKIEHVTLQNYLSWGRKSFDFIVKGGYSKRNILAASVKGDVYTSTIVSIDPSLLSKQPGNILKNVDFCIEAPYIYQFMVRNHKKVVKRALTKLVIRHKIDLIITTSPVIIDRRWFGKRTKVVQFVHDVMPLELLETPPDNNTPLVFGTQLYSAATESDAVFVNSEDTRQKVIEINPDASVYTLYGALPDKRPDTSDSSILTVKGLERGRYLLFNSVIEKRKNIENLLDAFAIAYDKIKMPLVLVGAPGYGFKDILAKYNSLPDHIRPHVLFTGWASNVDRLKLFENANAFIFPSLYEGLGIGILEAMEYSLPTLTTRAGALEEVGEDAVYYIENPYNVSEIAAGIIDIVSNTKLRNKLITRGLEIIPKYSQSKFNERAKRALIELR